VNFSDRVQLYRDLQLCAQGAPECIQAWASQHGLAYDYVYLRVPAGTQTIPLGALMEMSPDYELMYSSPTIKIYHRRAPGKASLPGKGAYTTASTTIARNMNIRYRLDQRYMVQALRLPGTVQTFHAARKSVIPSRHAATT
jgi:hypothetical protein